MPIGECKGTIIEKTEVHMKVRGITLFLYRFEYHVYDYDIERFDVCQQLLKSIYDFFN